MKAVVIYDSKFGNTKRVAEGIAESIGEGRTIAVIPASEATAADLEGIDLLAVGGPTQGHGLSAALKAFLDRVPAESVKDVPAVTFDTRVTWPRILAGSAAAAAAKRLTKNGAKMVVPPESFLVEGSEGPLVDGEIARARSWASQIRSAAGSPV